MGGNGMSAMEGMQQHARDVFFLGGADALGHRVGQNCVVEPVFGNMYVCRTCNVSHVCDQTCDQRIFYDNSTTICRFSRKLFHMTAEELAMSRNSVKRASGGAEMADKRMRKFGENLNIQTAYGS